MNLIEDVKIQLESSYNTPIYRDLVKNVNILFDSGAEVGLWHGTLSELKEKYDCISTEYTIKIKGVLSEKEECKINLINIKFGKILFRYIPVVVVENERDADLVLPYKTFNGLFRVFNDSISLSLCVKEDIHGFKDFERNVLPFIVGNKVSEIILDPIGTIYSD